MQWMQWMNKKKKQHWGDFFFLPSGLHSLHRLLLLLYPSCQEMTERVINCWNPSTGLPSRTFRDTHTRTQNFKFIIHVLCERGLNVTGCYLESPISMTTGLRIRVKNCHARAIVRAPWIRGALKSEGKEERTGVEMGEFGSAGRIKGRTREWVMILANIASPPHLLSL